MAEHDKYGIFIREHNTGFKIYYRSREFLAVKGEVKLKAESEKALEQTIKNHCRELRQFKPIDVIKLNTLKVGRITSRVADGLDMVWFSFKDDGKPSHSKEMIGHYSWETADRKKESNFVRLTEKNKQLLSEIEFQKKKIRQLEEDVGRLIKQFEEPVTLETIDKQAGEETTVEKEMAS